jgi:hypothetical protein
MFRAQITIVSIAIFAATIISCGPNILELMTTTAKRALYLIAHPLGICETFVKD